MRSGNIGQSTADRSRRGKTQIVAVAVAVAVDVKGGVHDHDHDDVEVKDNVNERRYSRGQPRSSL
jgi:hypothetical protein